MLFELGLSTKNDVINTGIIGVNKVHLDKLDYFNKFEVDYFNETFKDTNKRRNYINNENGEGEIRKTIHNDKYE